MFKKLFFALFLLIPFSLSAQLGTVINNGNTTTYSFKVTGWSGVLPDGPGLEIYTNPTNNLPSIQSYDRGGTNLYLPLVIGSSLLRITGRTTVNGASDDGSTALIVQGATKGTQFITTNSQARFGSDANSGAYVSNDIAGKPITFNTTNSSGQFGIRMYVDASGNVGIGTTKPQAKLSVNGTIFATKIKVTQAAADWPDFVFEKDYSLMPLGELEKFLTANKRLPGIPSAAEVREEGVDLGEMNKQLLRKVEELTLYIISQQKEITKLKEAVGAVGK